MRNYYLILAIVFSLFGVTLSSNASEADPIAIQSTEAPSESYLSTNKRSIGASTDVQTLSAPTRGLTKAGDTPWGWTEFKLAGEDGWNDNGETGNIGYPIGDVSLPILLSMILIYFVYRGVSSTKRRSNF